MMSKRDIALGLLRLAPHPLRVMASGVRHRMERWTPEEVDAWEVLRAHLDEHSHTHTRREHAPMVVAPVGLVGTRGPVIGELAEELEAVIVSADDIRVVLRDKGGFDIANVPKFVEHLMLYVLDRGVNVVLDSDYERFAKRASLEARLRPLRIPVYYIRTDPAPEYLDRYLEWQLYGELTDGELAFFGGASTSARVKDPERHARIVLVREIARQMSGHYVQENIDGSANYRLRRLNIPFVAEVDPFADPADFKRRMQGVFAMFD